MTTQTWGSVVNNTTDAGFRAWGSEFATKLAAAGLVQTADTGQINWATVTRAVAANTPQGYEIWKLPDSSFYFKIEYGSGAAANTPNMWVTVGTGSNGTGTITGQTNTRRNVGHSATDAGGSTSTARTSYLCVTNNFFGFNWKAGGGATGGTACAAFYFQKWTKADGTFSNDGFFLIYGAASGAASQTMACESVRVTAAGLATVKTWGNATVNYVVVPGGMTDSLTQAGDNQIFTHHAPTPEVMVMSQTCSVFEGEAVEAFTFTAAPVNGVSHTYLSTGTQGGLSPIAGVCLAMLWE